MADEAKPIKQYVKKPQFPAVGDLYPPNNSPEFLNNMAEAELQYRYDRYVGEPLNKRKAQKKKKGTKFNYGR